jgi:hypothetical protein
MSESATEITIYDRSRVSTELLSVGSVGDDYAPCRAVDADAASDGDDELWVGVAEVDVEDGHGVGGVFTEGL